MKSDEKLFIQKSIIIKKLVKLFCQKKITRIKQNTQINHCVLNDFILGKFVVDLF